MLFLIVLLVIAGVVAATCPAEYAYRLIADRLGVVKLAGISGSIWEGHASRTQVFGQELGALGWRLTDEEMATIDRVSAPQEP